MEINDISKELPIAGSNGLRDLKELQYAIVHHDAVLAPDDYNHISRYIAEAKYHLKKGWKRLGYHYKIARDGTVYLCSPLTEISYHAGNYKYLRSSIGVCLDGDFSKQAPSLNQLSSLRQLLNYLFFERPDIPRLVKKNLRCHSEVRLFPTTCPGEQLKMFTKSYRNSQYG